MNESTQQSYGKYTEHCVIETAGFKVLDATAEGHRGHDDVIWISYNDQGRWVSPDEADKIVAAIQDVVASHLERVKKQNAHERLFLPFDDLIHE